MSPKQLTLEDVHGSDPLARLAVEKGKFTPASAAWFFILAGIVYALLLPWLWGYPLQINGVDLLNLVLVFPAAGFFYLYQPKSILRAYESVARYLREEDDHHVFHRERIRARHAQPVWWLIGAGFGLLGAGFGVMYSAQQYGEFWYNANWFEIALIQTVRFLAYYAIGVSASRHIATSIELNNLFERADLPLAVEADRLEVFRAVKNFALEFVGVAAIIALNLGLQPLLIDPPMPEYAIYVGLYFIVAPVGFFLPLWEAHIRMAKIKNAILNRLHYDFQEESQRLHRQLNKKTGAALYAKEMEALTRLEKGIETVSRATDWPFQGITFYRLFVTVASPFLPAVFEVFINAIRALFAGG